MTTLARLVEVVRDFIRRGVGSPDPQRNHSTTESVLKVRLAGGLSAFEEDWTHITEGGLSFLEVLPGDLKMIEDWYAHPLGVVVINSRELVDVLSLASCELQPVHLFTSATGDAAKRLLECLTCLTLQKVADATSGSCV